MGDGSGDGNGRRLAAERAKSSGTTEERATSAGGYKGDGGREGGGIWGFGF